MKKVNVAFRKFDDGEVIAIFPNIYPVAKDSKAEVMSYMHVGQHGMCMECLVNELEKASKEEYAPLKKELEMIGYSVNVL